MNHVIQVFYNTRSKQIDFLKLSLNPKYSRFLEIDYYNQKCRISCVRDGNIEYIDIESLIEPDFPDLVKLKEKVSVYVVFS